MSRLGHAPLLPVTMLVVAVLAVTAALPGVWVRSTYGAQLSGDEPHYLLTAISLWEDGDLDLLDEFVEERYRPFHEIRLSPQGSTLDDDRVVAPHDPLLPALLALPWGLGGWEGAKLALAAVGGLLGALLVWTGVRRFGVHPLVAGAVSGGFVAAAPLAAYGSQLYPELPAALALLAGVASALGGARIRNAVGLGLAVIVLPWLAVKYVPVAAALAVVALARWWRAGERRVVAALVTTFLAAGVAYAAAHLAWYEGLTVYAVSDFFLDRGGQLSVVGGSPDPLGRSRRLIGLLVDDQFGLAAWQPAYLLAVPGLAALAHRRPAGWSLVALPLVVGWLVATFVALTMHGWWFPGRQVVVVLPLAVLAIIWLADRVRAWAAAIVTAALAGVFVWAWLLAEGLRGDLTLIVDFAATANPLHQAWQAALPNYLDVTTTTWALHGAWTLVAALLAVAGWRSVGASGRGPRSGAGAAAGAGPGAADRSADAATPLAVEVADRGTVVLAAGGEDEAGSERDGDGGTTAHGGSEVVGRD